MLVCVLYLLLLLLAVAADGYSSLRVKERFEAYKEKFGHDFGDDDDYRMAVFEDNLRYIEEENFKGERRVHYDVNIMLMIVLDSNDYMSSWTSTCHLRDTMFGRFPESQAPLGTASNTFNFNGSVEDLPKSVNYVTKGWVTEVKNQGTCGSCWAFSATGALEGLHKNVSGELVSLSEEDLIDCTSEYHNLGCSGGWMNQSFQYVADHGIESEKDYPYSSEYVPTFDPVTFPCHSDTSKDVIKAHSISYVNVKPETKASLLSAVASAGPVSVALNGMSKAFQHYGGGVLDSGCYPAFNHAVLTVGYDMEAEKPYYLVKNSWGTSWGEEGYIKIAIDDSPEGVCGILLAPSFPVKA